MFDGGRTGTTGTVPALGVCPAPGPGGTAGGAVSGGPVGVGTVGICPVVPGPAGTEPGPVVGGPEMEFVVPVSTGVGPCVAILSSNRVRIFIQIRNLKRSRPKTHTRSVFSDHAQENTSHLLLICTP